MTGFLHAFSDTYAHRDNWLTSLDPRGKCLLVAAALVVNLSATDCRVPLIIAVGCILALLSVGISARDLFLRMLMPSVIALAVLISQVFFVRSGAELFSLVVWGREITATAGGLQRGILVASCVLGGVSLVLLLSFSTSIAKLIATARWFHIPSPVVELTALLYRYIFLLFEESGRIAAAQKSRLGRSTWWRSMKAVAAMGGLMVIRSYDRAERATEAMHCRGYTGKITANGLGRFRLRSVLELVAMCAVVILLAMIGHVL